MPDLKPIMIVGTASDVGKSLVVTGICRWLLNKGYQPAPFKAQNMSLNSFATHDGLEIGRAQAVQAEACKIPCTTEMNPILLKPSSHHTSQIVLNGKPIGDQTAKAYFLGNDKEKLFEEAKKSFNKLSGQYQPIVMEGAGSISELNLKHRDIVNMRMAQAAEACVYLVADIDKGGVFGSVYGTIELLEDWEKKLLKGIIINKFRGDITLFQKGRQMMEELTGYPVLGVLPYDSDVYLEQEDSVALKEKNKKWEPGKLNIAVIQFHYLANYTDFNALEFVEDINVYYSREPEQIRKADVIILPGTKNTMADLQALKKDRLDVLIQELYGTKKIIGICGGYQMMGKMIYDPFHVENATATMEGIGLFDIETTLSKFKHTKQVAFRFKQFDDACNGYEIHMGETVISGGTPLNTINERPEGYLDENGSWGTYFHGIFDNACVIKDLMKRQSTRQNIDYHQFKEENFNKLAESIDQNLDMQAILKDIGVS
ncbi:MAG: cobyric acid synthase [Bacteroidota bacterium]